MRSNLLKVVLNAASLQGVDFSTLVKESQIVTAVVIKGAVVEAYLYKPELVKWCAQITGREPTEEMMEMIASYLFAGR